VAPSAKHAPDVYDESQDALESRAHTPAYRHVHRTLGDGSNPDDGIYILLKEVVDNAVDEFIMGAGTRILVRVEGGTVRVRDWGRGIPLGKVVECVSLINTGAKYNDDVFQFSVGLNGVGTKAVNALSSSFRVVSYREGRFFEAQFSSGACSCRSATGRRHGKSGRPGRVHTRPAMFGELQPTIMEFVESGCGTTPT
jgi:topoisomerase IV subunit B